MDVSSNNKFHQEQGINIKNLKSIIKNVQKKLEKDEELWDFELKFRGAEKTYPVGRAKQLNKKELKRYSSCGFYNGFKEESRILISIHPSGLASFCCWENNLILGSVIDNPLEELIQKSLENKVILTFLEKGPIAAMTKIGVPAKNYKNNLCKLCVELFEGYEIKSF